MPKHLNLTRLLIIFALIATTVGLEARSFNGREIRSSLGATKVVYDCCNLDVEPQFPGGEMAMLRYINANRHYPEEAYRDGIQGRVTCGFVIDADGKVADVRIVRGVEESLDREAMRLITTMPRWEAGVLSGQPVACYYTVTIPFRK